jgi:predicted metal-dependent HD superfamily phosphohydrolase
MITLREMSMLSALYAQSHRYYHNINHVMDCLAELESFSDKAFTYGDRQIVEKAIWYHDAVYNPYSKENEVNSAKLVIEDPEFLSDRIREIVIATANHLVTQEGLDLATQVMLDIDLTGFGKPWEICEMNANNIRLEYYNTNDLDFHENRLKFLSCIAKRDSLYYTDYFRGKYHDQSRKNLEQEIEATHQEIAYLKGNQRISWG